MGRSLELALVKLFEWSQSLHQFNISLLDPGMSRDCSTLMCAQYFKRKREFVEIFIVSGSGMGIALMSTFIKNSIESIGWRCVWTKKKGLSHSWRELSKILQECPAFYYDNFKLNCMHKFFRLGLQAVTVCVFSTFILGTCYRSASLYHPQRRAILHLKNQKRKIKDKNKQFDSPPFFDFSTLRSKTVRILLLSSGITWG